MHINSLIQRI